ncbi:MAG: hypothetical protein JWN76_1664 [Chitinophagaceae bacterium]|nr:hypothetical protein [Chitinophagaceae bacterium]
MLKRTFIICLVILISNYLNNRTLAQSRPSYHFAEMDYYTNFLFLETPSVYYQYAITLVKDKQYTKALARLERAMNLGYTDFKQLINEEAFHPLQADPKWGKIIQQLAINRDKLSSLKNFDVISSDVINFSIAAKKVNEPGFRKSLFMNYILPGSNGLKAFYTIRIFDPSNLAIAIEENPDLYNMLGSNLASIQSMKPAITSAMMKMKSIFNATVFPKVYFVVGINNTGGTVANEGLLLGIERQFIKDSSGKYQMKSTENIVPIVVHELVHFQQDYGPESNSLLKLAIKEGSADFICELLVGKTTYDNLKYFGEQNWNMISLEFKKDLSSNPINRWFYNGKGTSTWPGDLGYYIGYRISKAYYEKSSNKMQAIIDLLTTKDPTVILSMSEL